MVDRLVPASFADLKGFDETGQLQALQHMVDVLSNHLKNAPVLGPAKLGADVVRSWGSVAESAKRVETGSGANQFFHEYFEIWRVVDEERPQGLFTGYFEPELQGSRVQSDAYPFPVYAKPADLVAFDGPQQTVVGANHGKWLNGKPTPYDTREEIDQGSLRGRAEVLLYVSDISDLFFMQVQGSGRVTLENGEVRRLGYAAKSGRPYQSIGAILVRENLMAREAGSMQKIKSWLSDNPQRRMWLLWQNPSYVFFRELDLPDPHRGAIGAAGVQLIPQLSLAVDKSRYVYGTPVWLETEIPGGQSFNRMMIAADTGSAILGAARGDLYFGWGETAEHLAGHMKQPGRLHVLLPKHS